MSTRRVKATESKLGNELLDSLSTIVAQMLVEKLGASADVATGLGEQAAVELSRAWGGAQVYVPQGRIAKANAMHQEIWRKKLAGDHPNQLAREYGVSVVWIYEIIRNMRALYVDSVQMDVFREN